MTVAEEKEDSMKGMMVAQMRAYLDKIIDHLDLLELYEDRTRIKKQVGKVRKHITDDRKDPTVAELYAVIHSDPDPIEVMFHDLESPFPDRHKQEVFKRLWQNMTYIDRYAPPQPPVHPDYNAAPAVGNVATYVDQYGMNIFDTRIHRKMADAAIKQWERQHGKKLYAVDVRRSDPVEGYRHGDKA